MSGGVIDVEAVARDLAARIGLEPRAGIVLGSGLGRVSERLDRSVSVPFEALPGMPPATVPGHAGKFVGGFLSGVPVLLQAGRYHAYEGHGMDVVAAPVRVAAALGVEMLVFTNAAGGVRPDLEPADLVLIDDHVNLMFRNPLVGAVRVGERRFPDMSEPYDAVLRSLALSAASDVGVTLKRGVYGAVLGPSFETAAEVRALARLGIDVVGMSTVPEVIAARARGIRCLAVSMVTNRATGLARGPVSHEEVLAVGEAAGGKLEEVLASLFSRDPSSSFDRPLPDRPTVRGD